MLERFFRIYFPSIAVFLTSLLSISDVRLWLKKFISPGLQAWLPSYGVVQVGLSLVILAYVFLSQGRKFKRFMLFEKSVSKLIHERIQEIIDATDKDIRVNVALLRRTPFCLRQPIFNKNYLRKPRILRRIFVAVAWSTNMDHDSDKNPKFTVNQGVCGEAYRKRHVICRDLRKNKRLGYRLTKRQLELTSAVQYVISCPIWDMNLETSRQGERIIGVVNIDTCRSNLASQLAVKNSPLQHELIRKAKLLSFYCTKLYVK